MHYTGNVLQLCVSFLTFGQRLDDRTYYVGAFITPLDRLWVSPRTGEHYVVKVLVEIPDFNALLTAEVYMDDQEFLSGPVYEGIARLLPNSTFEGNMVQGDVWMEQKNGGSTVAKLLHSGVHLSGAL